MDMFYMAGAETEDILIMSVRGSLPSMTTSKMSNTSSSWDRQD